MSKTISYFEYMLKLHNTLNSTNYMHVNNGSLTARNPNGKTNPNNVPMPYFRKMIISEPSALRIIDDIVDHELIIYPIGQMIEGGGNFTGDFVISQFHPHSGYSIVKSERPDQAMPPECSILLTIGKDQIPITYQKQFTDQVSKTANFFLMREFMPDIAKIVESGNQVYQKNTQNLKPQ